MTDAHISDDERTSERAGSLDDSPGEGDVADRIVVKGQIGREPRAMQGVAARCVFGFAAATHQAPLDDAGRPFPTAYYLTCPHLVRQIDRIESTGGVRRFEQRLANDSKLRAATDAAHDRHAQVDDRGADIAATSDREHLKCLHAHAAAALADAALGQQPAPDEPQPVGSLVLAEAAPRWCDDARCASLLRVDPQASDELVVEEAAPPAR